MEIISNNPNENKVLDNIKSKEELEQDILNEILNEPDATDKEIIEDIKAQAGDIKKKREKKLQDKIQEEESSTSIAPESQLIDDTNIETKEIDNPSTPTIELKDENIDDEKNSQLINDLDETTKDEENPKTQEDEPKDTTEDITNNTEKPDETEEQNSENDIDIDALVQKAQDDKSEDVQDEAITPQEEIIEEIVTKDEVPEEEIAEEIKEEISTEIENNSEDEPKEEEKQEEEKEEDSTEEQEEPATDELDPIAMMVAKAKEEEDLKQQTQEAEQSLPAGSGISVNMGVDDLFDESEIEKPLDPFEALVETKQAGEVLEVDDETAKMLELVGDIANQAKENEEMGVDDPNQIIGTPDELSLDTEDDELIDTNLANSMVDDFFDGEEIESPNIEDFFAKEEEEAKKELEAENDENNFINDEEEDIDDFDDDFDDDTKDKKKDKKKIDIEEVDLSSMSFMEKVKYKIKNLKKPKETEEEDIDEDDFDDEPHELTPEEKKKKKKKIIIIVLVVLLLIGGIIAGLMFRPIDGVLSIKFQPEIAKVTVNGKEVLDTKSIPIKEKIKYNIKISADGYITQNDNIEYSYEPKEKLDFNLREKKIEKRYSLEKQTGKIEIISTPPGADIYISGKRINKKTPQTIEYETKLYDVRVQMKGYILPKVQTLDVKYKQTIKADFKLKRKMIKIKKKVVLPDPIVSIKSFPIANLYLDDKLKGQTPISFTVKKSKRNKVYKIRLEAKGYKPIHTSISVRKDTEVSYTLEEKRLGWITIKSAPKGAFLYFNGEPVTTKRTNLTMFQLKEGKYKLRVSKGEIYKDIEDTFKINKGEETTKSYIFKFKKGSLSIASKPTDATIYINGKDTRLKTPQLVDLTIGDYQIEVKKDGFARSVTKDVKVNYEQSSSVDFQLIQGEKRRKSFFIEPAMVKINKGILILNNKDDKFYFDEKTKHIISIKQDFYISKNEITFEEYDMYCYLTGARVPDDNGFKRGKIPVVNISWFEAKSYANWLSQMSGRNYSLPTEAQWRYIAKKSGLSGLGWFNINSGGHPHLVGSKRKNSSGLYDFYGNVWEWTEDWYQIGYKTIPSDGSANQNGDKKYKVIVGGGYNSSIEDLDLYNRTSVRPLAQKNNIGFRLISQTK